MWGPPEPPSLAPPRGRAATSERVREREKERERERERERVEREKESRERENEAPRRLASYVVLMVCG